MVKTLYTFFSQKRGVDVADRDYFPQHVYEAVLSKQTVTQHCGPEQGSLKQGEPQQVCGPPTGPSPRGPPGEGSCGASPRASWRTASHRRPGPRSACSCLHWSPWRSCKEGRGGGVERREQKGGRLWTMFVHTALHRLLHSVEPIQQKEKRGKKRVKEGSKKDGGS